MIARRGMVRRPEDLFHLLRAAAKANVTGVLHFLPSGRLYLVEGEIYAAQRRGDPELVDLLVEAGALTPEEAARLRRQSELMLSQVTRVARAEVGLDRPACHAAIRRLVEDVVLELAQLGEMTFQLDPYGVHPLNVVASWPVADVLAPVRLALARLPRAPSREAATAAPPQPAGVRAAGPPPAPPPPVPAGAVARAATSAGVAEPVDDEETPRKAALRRLIGAIRRL
jgi:hypothetical protein